MYENNDYEKMKELEKFTIKLSDGRILQFEGQQLAYVDNEMFGKGEQLGWIGYTLYRTRANKYLLYERYSYTQGQISDGFKIFNTEQELKNFASEIDCVEYGFYRILSEAAIPIIVEVA